MDANNIPSLQTIKDALHGRGYRLVGLVHVAGLDGVIIASHCFAEVQKPLLRVSDDRGEQTRI